MFTQKAIKGIALRMIGAIVVGLAIWPGQQAVHAQSTTSALTGQVTSLPEGRMEGVLVNARREGSSFTVSVVSDETGVYSFPSDRLEPGEYTLRIQAAGYVLRPSTRVVKVTGGGSRCEGSAPGGGHSYGEGPADVERGMVDELSDTR